MNQKGFTLIIAVAVIGSLVVAGVAILFILGRTFSAPNAEHDFELVVPSQQPTANDKYIRSCILYSDYDWCEPTSTIIVDKYGGAFMLQTDDDQIVFFRQEEVGISFAFPRSWIPFEGNVYGGSSSGTSKLEKFNISIIPPAEIQREFNSSEATATTTCGSEFAISAVERDHFLWNTGEPWNTSKATSMQAYFIRRQKIFGGDYESMNFDNKQAFVVSSELVGADYCGTKIVVDAGKYIHVVSLPVEASTFPPDFALDDTNREILRSIRFEEK